MLPASSDPSPVPRGGRPRSEGCRQKVLAAADTLFARDGLSKMTVDAVAQEAGVGKATIYRWWPNKTAIVMDALLASTEAETYVPVSAFPEQELIARITRTVALFRGPKGRVIASLLGQAQSDPEIAQAYRDHLLVPRRAGMRDAIERCIAAGLYRDDIDIDLAIDILYGPLYQRLMLGHAPIDDKFERDYPAIAVAALRVYAAHSNPVGT
jgi:AcrR family transcriptional regulator